MARDRAEGAQRAVVTPQAVATVAALDLVREVVRLAAVDCTAQRERPGATASTREGKAAGSTWGEAAASGPTPIASVHPGPFWQLLRRRAWPSARGGDRGAE